MRSLEDIVENIDQVAKTVVYRTVAHSMMAKCIGAIRQDIRDRKFREREQDIPQVDLDQRNTFDEDDRAENEVAEAMGFATTESPLARASLYHAVYDWALSSLQTPHTSKWDAPLGIEQMLEFMASKSTSLDETTAKQIAKVVKTDMKNLEKLHELQASQEKERLIEETPEILATFKGFGENGYADVLDVLPPIDQHQLAVKVVENLRKARDKALLQILRTKRLSDLANIPLLEEAENKVKELADELEKEYFVELQEAIEQGRYIRTVDDLAA